MALFDFYADVDDLKILYRGDPTKKFTLPEGITYLGIQVNANAFYNRLGRNENVAPAITLMIGGRDHPVKRCNGVIAYEWNGKEHTLPLSRENIAHLMAPSRPSPQRRRVPRSVPVIDEIVLARTMQRLSRTSEYMRF